MKKTLKEIAKEKGKELFIESSYLQITRENMEIPKNEVLIESEGKSYKARAILKNVPISGYGENLNNRKYSKELWETVCKKKMGEGSFSLMGHPEDEGNPKDIAGVWHNLKVGEKCPFADLYLIGDNGSLIQEAIDAGSKIGISSVGYGEFESDGKTVKAESYELERIGDLVLQPSQEVYATNENLNQDENNSIKEDKNNKVLENNFTNKIEQESFTINKENNNNGVLRMDKFDEINHRNQVKQRIREARKNSDYNEAIQSLQDLEVHSDDLRKDVEQEVETIQNKLDEQIKNSKNTISTKEKEIKDLNDKLDVAVKTVDGLKEKYEKAKSIIESVGLSEEDEPEKLKEEKTRIEEELKIAKENIKLMQEDIDVISVMFEDSNMKKIKCSTVEDVKQLAEDTEKRDEDIKWLAESLEEAEKHIEECEKKLEEMGFKFEDAKKKKSEQDDDKDKKEEQDDEDKKVKEQDKDKDKEEEKKEQNDKDKDEKEKKESFKRYEFKYKEQKDEDDEDKEVKEQDKDKDKEEKKEQKDEDEDEKDKNKSEKKENKSDVVTFIDREIKKNQALKDVEKEVKNSKTLSEAIDKVDIFLSESRKDSHMKYEESDKDKKWGNVERYKFRK